MDGKAVVFENPSDVGTFSVGDAVNSHYDRKVTTCVARDGIEMTANFFFKRSDNPKICVALDSLMLAMLEEGADEVEIFNF